MNRSHERLARTVRIREAATRGIRLVPADPDPKDFPAVTFACDQRPQPCGACSRAARCDLRTL